VQGGMTRTRTCPLCASEINGDDRICAACGAKFEITERGYCRQCERVVTPEDDGACPFCAGELTGRVTSSRLVDGAQAAFPNRPPPLAAAAAQASPNGPMAEPTPVPPAVAKAALADTQASPAGPASAAKPPIVRTSPAGQRPARLPVQPPLPVTGELRRACLATPLRRCAIALTGITSLLLAALWAISHLPQWTDGPPLVGDTFMMARDSTQYFMAPWAFPCAVLAIWLVYPAGVRRMLPKEPKKVSRQQRYKTFRAEMGRKLDVPDLYLHASLRPAAAVGVLIWVAVLLTNYLGWKYGWQQYSDDPTITLSMGFWLSTSIAVVGLSASVTLLFSRSKVVRVDEAGILH
jgi:RNA polymerase subunit RPABC4/transcription elongation factor Spt4